MQVAQNTGIKATVNSDDPSYFGDCLLDNFMAVTEAHDLDRPDLVILIWDMISFLDEPAKKARLARRPISFAQQRHATLGTEPSPLKSPTALRFPKA